MPSTFATLRALHLVIADALDDVQRVFAPASPPTTPPPTPLSPAFPDDFVDYPDPHAPLAPDSPGERLALHPDAAAAAARIVAACGQMASIVHKPFLSLCDAIMSYNLSACMRLVEHLHVAEILREAEQDRQRRLAAVPSSAPRQEGLHVDRVTDVICAHAGDGYVNPSDLVHALRLLSTHHIFRETAPDTFALTRVASLLDSGKSVESVFSSPETKYDDTGGIPAFVALTTDELFKAAAYLTEGFTGVQLPSPRSAPDPALAADAVLASVSSHDIKHPPCALTTRSSSVLTHIAYPEDGDIRRPLCPLSTKLQGNDESCPASPRLPQVPLPPTLCLSPVEATPQVEKDPIKPERLLPFNLAFHTRAPLFEWLENGGEDPLGGTGQAAGMAAPTKTGVATRDDVQHAVSGSPPPQKAFRLERFSKAMMATTGWEAPKAILGGFDWYSLPKGSTIVDVGGGIGSTTMILASALNDLRADAAKGQDDARDKGTQPIPPGSKLSSDASFTAGVNLRFVVQDRPVVTALGVKAWRSKCPEMLDNGCVVFQDQDFFEPQPYFEPPHLTRHPAVYLLRVVLHDWPDELARRILINLRVASNPETRLVIAEHVLPLACVDEDIHDEVNAEACKNSSTEEWTLNSVLAHIEGAERTLVPPPLLSNLGKASANAYWMDIIMHISLNGKERTLREFCALALSAGWRITRMTRPEGSLFAYLVCEPITLPDDAQAIYNAVALFSELSTVVAVHTDDPMHLEPSRHKRLPPRPVSLLHPAVLERSSSRCGTPTFGSRIALPKDEELQAPRPRGAGAAKKWFKSKGLGVRGVMLQKAEKQEDQGFTKGTSAQDNADGQNEGPAPAPHMRVWWKKSPPNSSSNSSVVIQDLIGDVSKHRTTERRRRGTLKSSDSPSTPSPRMSPSHQNWPSIESASEASPAGSRIRRPSVASITRKLSFATFGRRPSIVDITEPLPTLGPSATLTELAPPPALKGDTGRGLKHLPSLPTLGRSEVVTRTSMGQPALPRRPSLSFVSQAPPLQPVPKSTLPRRPGIAESPKSSILKTRTSPYPSQPGFPDPGQPAAPTEVPRQRRRVTLSNSPGVLTSARARPPGGVTVASDHAITEVRRVPSVPKLPRRLSIPMLRRKQSQPVMKDGAKGG